MEILGIVCMVYVVVMLLIFVGVTTWKRDWDSVIGVSLIALIALTWPVSLPIFFKEYLSDRKQRKDK